MLGRVFAVLIVMAAQSMVTATFAQSPGYMPNTIDRRLKPTPFQQVKDKWNTLSETDISCIESALQQQNTDIENLMQKGIVPSDPRLSKIRSDCRAQGEAAATDTTARKNNAVLAEKLMAAQTEIQRLQAEIDQLKKEAQTRVQARPLRGNNGPAAMAAQKDASYNAIMRLIEVVVAVLGILFFIGLFVPNEWIQNKKRQEIERNR